MHRGGALRPLMPASLQGTGFDPTFLPPKTLELQTSVTDNQQVISSYVIYVTMNWDEPL